ncbi:DUF6544 family protein [Rhizobium sp. 60-20]|uniref:DUF6544 family protein n=1 Tax=Rhizobium sp. 60-20 TaxID=1895819 RepID=UPI001AC46289|nr:hypothetical protein [Rhizobium tropici]
MQIPSAIEDLANRLGFRPGRGSAARLSQVGTMRNSSDGRWTKFTATQRIDFQNPGFEWRARVGPFGLLCVRDALKDEGPILDVKVLGIRLISASSGPSATKGEIMRYLAELAWAPDAIMQNEQLHWRVLNHDTLSVACEAQSARGEVQLGLDSDGRIGSVYAPDRPRREGATFVERPWRGRFYDYRWHDGRWLPFAGEVGWDVGGESFVAWRGELTNWAIEV